MLLSISAVGFFYNVFLLLATSKLNVLQVNFKIAKFYLIKKKRLKILTEEKNQEKSTNIDIKFNDLQIKTKIL